MQWHQSPEVQHWCCKQMMGIVGVHCHQVGHRPLRGVHLEHQWKVCPLMILMDSVVVRGFDRIPSTTPGAEPPRDGRDSGSARSHSTHLETSSSDRP